MESHVLEYTNSTGTIRCPVIHVVLLVPGTLREPGIHIVLPVVGTLRKPDIS
jgi:hypothetical protein